MRIIIILNIISLLTIFSPGRAQEKLSREDVEYISFMEFYYIEKNIGKIPEFMNWLEQSKFLERVPSSGPAITSFISETYVRNSLFYGKLTKTTYSGTALAAVKYALFIGGGHQVLDEVFDINKGKNYRFSSIKSMIPIRHPADLGWLWGEFHASGNVANIKNLIDVLDEKERLNGDARIDAIIRQTAASLLQKNSQHHEIVNRAVQAGALEKQGNVQIILKSILENNKKLYSPLKNRNGDFSADILIINPNELAKFNTPFYEKNLFKVVEKTTKGQAFSIKIMFSGPELNDNLKADVEFDLKIKDPSGKEEILLPSAVALNQRVPARFRIFNSYTHATIEFDSKNPTGKYIISSSIRDKIGNKTIQASREIELID